MTIRDLSNPGSHRLVGGDGQNVPAVIVIRRRTPPGTPRDDLEIRVNLLDNDCPRCGKKETQVLGPVDNHRPAMIVATRLQLAA